MAERHKIKAAVYAIVKNENGQVLFLRRNNTGYMDGKLSLPSGHVEINESFVEAAARETFEESGVVIALNELTQVLTLHRYQPSGEFDYIDMFFQAKEWSGEPRIVEEDKASELVWAHPEDIEHDLIPYMIPVFQSIKSGDALIELQRGDDE